MNILKNITEQLHGNITEANFEGANIVLYTNNENFFKDDKGKIREIVNDIKKRVELRADQKILPKQEEVEADIKKIVPEEAEITNIIFDFHRSIVMIEAKKPGLVIGKGGSIKPIDMVTNFLGRDVDYTKFANYCMGKLS